MRAPNVSSLLAFGLHLMCCVHQTHAGKCESAGDQLSNQPSLKREVRNFCQTSVVALDESFHEGELHY